MPHRPTSRKRRYSREPAKRNADKTALRTQVSIGDAAEEKETHRAKKRKLRYGLKDASSVTSMCLLTHCVNATDAGSADALWNARARYHRR
jgi:hypothetical protein